MHRVIVVLLAAFDAALAVAVGLVVVLAPLTLVWVLGWGQAADWSALWPASATIWQFGNLVPLLVTLPAGYLATTGIDPAAASFWLSLAPLAFAMFTAIFAARSGARASRADAWFTGVVAGGAGFAGLTTLVAMTARSSIAAIHLWQAVLFPSLVFVVSSLIGAFVVEWREANTGLVARLRDRVESRRDGWGDVPALAVRGTAAVLVGLIGAGALVVAVSLLFRGGEVIALFESGHVDVLGATITTLAQLAYLPTVIVWGLSFVAGPGFSLGVGTSVSPAGTQVGVLPGVPLLGAVPESVSSWLLLVTLAPVALAAFAGWIVRSRLVAPAIDAPHSGDGDLREGAEPIAVRLALTVAIAALSAAGAALLALLASGALGPGRLAEVGPQPGPVAMAVGLEVLLGAGILLLSPRPRRDPRSRQDASSVPATTVAALPNPQPSTPEPADTAPTAPIAPLSGTALAAPLSGTALADHLAETAPIDGVTAGVTPRRPSPLPPPPVD